MIIPDIEKAARIGYETALATMKKHGYPYEYTWEQEDEEVKDDWRQIAKAILNTADQCEHLYNVAYDAHGIAYGRCTKCGNTTL